MSSFKRALAVLAVSVAGLWGCAPGPVNGPSVERIRALESKNSKLDEDFRAAAAARDQLKKKLAAVEEQKAQLAQQVGQLGREIEQLQGAVRERDDLRQQVAYRTAERDSLQAQFDHVKKGLRSLLGQTEAAAIPAPQPVTSAAGPARSPKS